MRRAGLLPAVALIQLSDTRKNPDGSLGWVGLVVLFGVVGLALTRLPQLVADDGEPTYGLRRDLLSFVPVVVLLGGFLAWQWSLVPAGGDLGRGLTVAGAIAAVAVLVIGFDVLVLAHAPWYTFSEGLVIGSSFGGRRRVLRYADVTSLWYSEWSKTWVDDRFVDLGAPPRHRDVEHHWHRLLVRRSRGLRFTSSTVDGRYDNLSFEIRYGVQRAQLAGVRARIDAGESVRFGPIVADATGLRSGDRVLPWETISRAHYDERRFTVALDPGPAEVSFRARRVRNGVTLNALHRKLTEESVERDRVAKLKPRRTASD